MNLKKIFRNPQSAIYILLLFALPLYAAEGGLKIVSLAPSITEILFDLGLKDSIAGVTTYCSYPEEAKGLPKVGTYIDPDIERISQIKPGIIFVYDDQRHSAVNTLKKMGFNVVVLRAEDIGGVMSSILKIGEHTGRPARAAAIVDDMKAGITEIRNKAALNSGRPAPKVYVEIWHDPIITAGRGSFVDEMIAMAGGENIAHDLKRPYDRFSAEVVIERNPDFILLGYMSTGAEAAGEFKKRLGWSGLTAVKNGNIIDSIDPDLFLRQGPRLANGLKEIYRAIWGE